MTSRAFKISRALMTTEVTMASRPPMFCRTPQTCSILRIHRVLQIAEKPPVHSTTPLPVLDIVDDIVEALLRQETGSWRKGKGFGEEDEETDATLEAIGVVLTLGIVAEGCCCTLNGRPWLHGPFSRLLVKM